MPVQWPMQSTCSGITEKVRPRKRKRRPLGDADGEADPQTVLVRRQARHTMHSNINVNANDSHLYHDSEESRNGSFGTRHVSGQGECHSRQAGGQMGRQAEGDRRQHAACPSSLGAADDGGGRGATKDLRAVRQSRSKDSCRIGKLMHNLGLSR